MKPLVFHDPPQGGHEYLTKMFFEPFRAYLTHLRIPFSDGARLSKIKDSIVISSADHLDHEAVVFLMANSNTIVGFSVTDSSYIAEPCRHAVVLRDIDLMFMLTGIQKINHGHELTIDKDNLIKLEERQFLPDEDWQVFDSMRQSGRLKSLPYVPWERPPDVTVRSYNTRSQKVLLRGGNHMRRFLLALHLMQKDLLDTNSGFCTAPYFSDAMRPDFRFCDQCRAIWKRNRRYPYNSATPKPSCTNPMWQHDVDLSDLGQWNNRCPESFYAVAKWFGAPMDQVEKLLNAEWLKSADYFNLLGRITFTSDLKWLFSIYAAQRFWDAAIAGCVNVLPSRSIDQDYFPFMGGDWHYLAFDESMESIPGDFTISEKQYNNITGEARALYDEWIRPSEYVTNTNLLKHILTSIESI